MEKPQPSVGLAINGKGGHARLFWSAPKRRIAHGFDTKLSSHGMEERDSWGYEPSSYSTTTSNHQLPGSIRSTHLP